MDLINATSLLMKTTFIEQPAYNGFRIWHVMFMSFALVLTIIIMVCCCVKIRIPRTKQEIEADYQRKKLTREFQKQLKQIKNEEMDIMDLKRALETIHKEIYSIQDTTDPPLSHSSSINAPASINSSESHKISDDGMVAEPQKPTSTEWTKTEGGLNRTFSQKVSALLKLSKLKNLPTLDDEDNLP